MQKTIKHSKLRQTWLVYHRIIALLFCLFFAFICASGSLCLYSRQLDEFFNRELVVKHPSGDYARLETIVTAIKAAHPARHDVWVLEMPSSKHSMITAWYENPYESFGKLYAPLMVSVNPYTAEVVVSRFWGQTAITRLLDLHKQLNMEKAGWYLVGLSGVMLSLSIISGLYLWWPQRSTLLLLLSFDKTTRLSHLTKAVHHVLGLAAALPLLVLALSGLHLSFPGILETLTASANMAHGNEGKNVVSTAQPSGRSVSADEAVLIGRGPFPSAELRRLATPAGETGTYRINLAQADESSRLHPYTLIWVDRWSGQIREVRNPRQFGAGERFIAAIWSLHSAEASGGLLRFIWFVVGLMPLVLIVSGTLHYLIKRKIISDWVVNLAAIRRHLGS